MYAAGTTIQEHIKHTYSFVIMYAFLHAFIAIVYMAMDKNNHICVIVYAFLHAFIENSIFYTLTLLC